MLRCVATSNIIAMLSIDSRHQVTNEGKKKKGEKGSTHSNTSTLLNNHLFTKTNPLFYLIYLFITP